LSLRIEKNAFEWTFTDWSAEHYVLLPAGAYAGNRFRSLRLPYSPRLPEEECGRDIPTIITDVPRLNNERGCSALHLLSGDLAFPLCAWFDQKTGHAWAVLVTGGAECGDVHFALVENEARNAATLQISHPGVRPSPVYRMITLTHPSPDPLPRAIAGNTLAVRVEEWNAKDIPDFLDRIFSFRELFAPAEAVPATLSFYAASALVGEHYHRDLWNEKLGVFATTASAASAYYSQTGWCGGLISTLPLLTSGNPQSRSRARRNLEVFFANAPTKCGLFLGKCRPDGVWEADFEHDHARPHTRAWHLIRRSADALFFLLPQIEILETDAPATWGAALRRCADTFVGIWRHNGQFGQFVNQHTGDILVGNSASGALIPAALCRAAKVWNEPEYLRVACEAGEFFAWEFLARGITTGGPGDACQNPDSESAAALVESYAALYDETREARWLAYGRTATALLATWIMPGNFTFPEGSEFHRLDLRTPGTVFANTQNKHSAPGLCTGSGLGLLRLFRATGDERIMRLLQSIARALPQFVSRPDRPIHAQDGRALPSGWINERVNTSDWDENVGGVFYDACWCEVSLLLTAMEVPGIYARTDLQRIWALDHIQAEWRGFSLLLTNTTGFAARVKVLMEDPIAASTPLSSLWFQNAPTVDLQPGESRIFAHALTL